MSEQEVTYSTVRFHESSRLQKLVRTEEPQRPREACYREYSVPWKLIVIACGILCFLLLVTVALLAITKKRGVDVNRPARFPAYPF
uniref:Ly49G transcript variant 7 n=1 Tax=Mus musculus TaxID=10090 RepID=A0A0E3UR74_MOUSE|nr:Ly49G transcript variant 7 [Mus musculus]